MLSGPNVLHSSFLTVAVAASHPNFRVAMLVGTMIQSVSPRVTFINFSFKAFNCSSLLTTKLSTLIHFLLFSRRGFFEEMLDEVYR